MKLTEARARAVKAISGATRGDVTVTPFDGVMDAKEVLRQQIRPPAVHVMVMGRDDDRNALLAAYVMSRMRTPTAADEDGLKLVDAVEEAMRTLLGAGRPLLQVRVQAVYDTRAERAGALATWVVSTALPPLVGDAPDGTDAGLVQALDALLAQYLTWRWASTEPQRERLLLGGALPFALVTYGADSPVESAVGVYRYQEAGALYERDTLGRREVTAQVDLLGRTEKEVETALDALLARIPRSWTYEGLTLPVTVRRVVGSHWRRKEGAHATVAEVRLQAAVPQGEPRVVETRTMQGRTECGAGFQPAPAAVPAVTTNGAGTGAAVESIDVDRDGRIVSVQWADRGSGYAVGDRLIFAQGAIFGRVALDAAAVVGGELQNLALRDQPITWVEDGKVRQDVQPQEDA